MKKYFIYFISYGLFFLYNLTAYNEQFKVPNKKDWLIQYGGFISKIFESPENKNVSLENGFVKKIFRIIPKISSIDCSNLSSGEQLIIAIGPEATITLDDQKNEIDGLCGQKERCQLKKEWPDSLINPKKDFAFHYHKIQSLPQSIFDRHCRHST
jgi:hypothetical protein